MADGNASLRERVLDALASEGPDVLRIVNAGTLEEELWTDSDWRDEYADVLVAELAAMVKDGLLATAETWGMATYWLAPQELSEHPGSQVAQDNNARANPETRASEKGAGGG